MPWDEVRRCMQTRVWKRGDAGRGGEESQNEKEKLSGVTLYDYL